MHANVATHVFTARITYVPKEDLSSDKTGFTQIGPSSEYLCLSVYDSEPRNSLRPAFGVPPSGDRRLISGLKAA